MPNPIPVMQYEMPFAVGGLFAKKDQGGKDTLSMHQGLFIQCHEYEYRCVARLWL